MDARALPPEVWSRIFEGVVGYENHDGRSRDRNAPTLALVCRAWNAISEPYRYRRISIEEPKSIEAFDRLLVHLDLRGRHPFRHTHDFFALTDEEDYSVIDFDKTHMPHLLSFASHLECVCFGSPVVNPSTLHSLAVTSSRTLTELWLTLCDLMPICLSILPRFTELRSLHIDVGLEEGSAPSLAATDAIALPKLRDLSLTTSGIMGCSDLVLFLARSTFPSLTTVEFPDEPVASSAALKFFARHGPGLFKIDILIAPNQQHSLPLIISHCHILQQIVLHAAPSADIVERLVPALPATLSEFYLSFRADSEVPGVLALLNFVGRLKRLAKIRLYHPPWGISRSPEIEALAAEVAGEGMSIIYNEKVW